ncbi:MAG: thiamine phosphate synthase [Gammaproteobacteria bacterium]|nr:thiamine phosphate synthase [Gammaproteobacteria bacterium]
MAQAPILSRGVYAITDETLLTGDLLCERVQAALEAGLSVLQYRNKHSPQAERVAQCQALKTLCGQFQTPFLINDDVNLCLEVGADGVHLGQGDARLRSARQRLGDSAIIGITCHNNLILARDAQAQGASYVAFGRFFPSNTKPLAPPATLDDLRQARAALRLPIVAIGGINAENGATLIDAGADMLAVIHYLFATPDVCTRTRQLNSLFQPSIAPPNKR